MTVQLRRIAFVDPYPHLDGGAQTTTRLLARGLRDRGIDAAVVTTAEGTFTDRLSAAGIPWSVVHLPGALTRYGHRTTGRAAGAALAAIPQAWSRLTSSLRRSHPDVVQCTDLRGVLLAGVPARAAGAAPVWHVHATEPQPTLNRVAARLSARVVISSAAGAAALVGVSPQRIEVVANAVNPRALDAEEVRVKQDATAPHLVTCARLAPEKGLEVLIDAVETLRRTYPGIHATVFGAAQEGYEEFAQGLHRLIDEKGLKDRVVLAGGVEEPFRFFGDAAVYVHPSHREVLPLAIMEAMASGLPVVATAVGGVGELVEDGKTGLLVPAGDARALAAAVDTLLGDLGAAEQLGRAGSARIRASYTVDAMVDRWIDLYTRL